MSYAGDSVPLTRVSSSYVGDKKSYVGDNSNSYVGDNKSYVGNL